jgi:AraC-like DNA-binding protein
MSARRNKSLHAVFTMSAATDAGNDTAAPLWKADREIRVRVSTLKSNVTFTTSSDTFSSLVLINKPAAYAVKVTVPDASEIDALSGPGDMCLLPPGTVVRARSSSGAEVVQYDFAKDSLRAFADRFALQDSDSLNAPNFTRDPFLQVLSKTVRPLLGQRIPTPDFDEYFTHALYRYFFERHGTKEVPQEHFVGGLSPRHKRFVEEVLNVPSDANLSIESLALTCGLSIRHFARAFRQSFGVPFYRHLMNLRVSRAKQLLLETDLPLKAIAARIGYADQTTFTECFTREAGSPPGRFRRRYGKELAEDQA